MGQEKLISGIPAHRCLRRRVQVDCRENRAGRPVMATLVQVQGNYGVIKPPGHGQNTESVPLENLKIVWAYSPDLKADYDEQIRRRAAGADEVLEDAEVADVEVTEEPVDQTDMEPESETHEDQSSESWQPSQTEELQGDSASAAASMRSFVEAASKLLPTVREGCLLFSAAPVSDKVLELRHQFERRYNEVLRGRHAVVALVAEYMKQLKDLEGDMEKLRAHNHWMFLEPKKDVPCRPSAVTKPQTKRPGSGNRSNRPPGVVACMFNCLVDHAQEGQQWHTVDSFVEWIYRKDPRIEEFTVMRSKNFAKRLVLNLMGPEPETNTLPKGMDATLNSWREVWQNHVKMLPAESASGKSASYASQTSLRFTWKNADKAVRAVGSRPQVVSQ